MSGRLDDLRRRHADGFRATGYVGAADLELAKGFAEQAAGVRRAESIDVVSA